MRAKNGEIIQGRRISSFSFETNLLIVQSIEFFRFSEYLVDPMDIGIAEPHKSYVRLLFSFWRK